MKLIKTIPLLIVAGLGGCRELYSEHYLPIGHPADPSGASSAPISVPPLEPTSETVRPKVSQWQGLSRGSRAIVMRSVIRKQA